MAKPSVNELDRQIGLRLKRLRQREGLSAAALAEATGSTQQQISRYENAQNKISAAQLYLLAQRFAVPLSWFFLDSEAAPSQTANSLAVKEQPPGTYIKNSSADEAATLQALWSRLTARQRSATLKLLDSFLEK